MQVFHWSRPVVNYDIFESRDQCLQGQLGLVVVSCRGESVKYQTGMSVNLTACRFHFPTQSKKKSIFLSDSDEEAIMEFIKQHEELYDKTKDKFKDKQKKEILWETLATNRNLPVNTVNTWFETQRTRYGKLTQTRSGQAAENSPERQT